MTDTSVSESTVVAAGDHLTTELEGELVILDADSGTYYGLNEVGRRIWELIDEPRSVADIERRLLEEYDVEREQVAADVRSLVDDLATRGLVSLE
ncbi:PqqD family protein [Natronobiforma cellulositropha]|uniref:PqqD family protein n=1 Tax=Natronobiforma cellulositropha TaxID=1679076 RepID=UPI0021D5DC89|nr:PqqD family protein [Natronobiforma cellulositropha]